MYWLTVIRVFDSKVTMISILVSLVFHPKIEITLFSIPIPNPNLTPNLV